MKSNEDSMLQMRTGVQNHLSASICISGGRVRNLIGESEICQGLGLAGCISWVWLQCVGGQLSSFFSLPLPVLHLRSLAVFLNGWSRVTLGAHISLSIWNFFKKRNCEPGWNIALCQPPVCISSPHR